MKDRQPDYRDSLVNVALMLKPLIRMIDDSCHDESQDIIEFRNAIYHAYELSNDLIKRVYATPRPQLHAVQYPWKDPT